MADDPLSPHFETELQLDSYALATTIYAERDDGKILLLERAEGSAMAGFFFPPGGLVDPGEEPYQAAARELIEESGLTFITPPQMVGCYPMFVYGRRFLNLTFRGPVAGELVTSHEHTASNWVTPQYWANLFTSDAVAKLAGDNHDVAALLTGIGQDALRYLELIGATT